MPQTIISAVASSQCRAKVTVIPAIAETGDIGAEDVAAGAFAFFPAVSVNERGAAVIGFTAADDSIFPGAYAVSRRATDAKGEKKSAGNSRGNPAIFFQSDAASSSV